MRQNTKLLFGSILRLAEADCVCDIGSRDGDQALFFKQLLPQANVCVFEANPFNFKTMKEKQSLLDAKIDLQEVAVSNENGSATFHVIDVDYSNPNENTGISSLLSRDDLKEKMAVTVPAVRIDDFIIKNYPTTQRVGLWIDVEGAEYLVLNGLDRIKDRIIAIHVESWLTAKWKGQRLYPEVEQLLREQGFVPYGNNLTPDMIFGDFVFIHQQWQQSLGSSLRKAQWKGRLGGWLKADALAYHLKNRLPWLYRLLRQFYIKFGT